MHILYKPKNIKKTLFTLSIVFLYVSLVAQEQNQKPKLLLRPYFENGIDFIQNEQLKQDYQTNTKYYWGLGLQFGHPERSKIIPFAQLTFSSFDFRVELSNNQFSDHTLSDRQFVGGIQVPIIKRHSMYVTTRFGYSHSTINESFHEIYSSSHGLQVGIEKKIIGNARMYIDLIYNYQKANTTNFKDFDMVKVAIGFVL